MTHDDSGKWKLRWKWLCSNGATCGCRVAGQWVWTLIWCRLRHFWLHIYHQCTPVFQSESWYRARCLCSAYRRGLVSFETRPQVMIWLWLQTCMSLQFVGQDLVAEAIDSLQSCYCDGCERPALVQLCTYHNNVLLLCKGSPILRLRE